MFCGPEKATKLGFAKWFGTPMEAFYTGGGWQTKKEEPTATLP